MSTIIRGKVVEIEYTLRLADGEIADSTEEQGPMRYLHGYGDIIPGLETALDGRRVGDELSVTVAPAEGFGEYEEDLVDAVPRSELPADVEINLGDEITAIADDGTEIDAYVTEIEGDTVYVDMNHPLAGETLFYELKVVAMRDATAEEIEHGHVHDGDHEDEEEDDEDEQDDHEHGAD